MNLQRTLKLAAACLCSLLSLFSFSYAKDTEVMQVIGVPADPTLRAITGDAWALYLDGPIDSGAAKRLEDFIVSNNVPRESWAILNSPGGSLFGGMELGRVIRKYDLRTDIGERKPSHKLRLEYDTGECHSACTLAFIGGKFRFLHSGSRFGVHRFAFSSPQKGETDLAQIASASIVTYLREMDVDPDLFSLSTKAGPSEIYEPTAQELSRLKVVNNGFENPKWSIESNNGFLYLKGERDTVYGINKFLLSCPDPSGMVLYVIFDPQGRDDEVMSLPAHSLVIDGKTTPVKPISKRIVNGWFNTAYNLTIPQVRAIQRAKSVGLIVQPSYSAPIFLGFNEMPFEEGAHKLAGIVNSCGFANTKTRR